MSKLIINVDYDKRCAECGKTGATDSGICLKCITKAIGTKPMKSLQGQAVQKRMNEIIEKARKESKRP